LKGRGLRMVSMLRLGATAILLPPKGVILDLSVRFCKKEHSGQYVEQKKNIRRFCVRWTEPVDDDWDLSS
jgi:hypothetical protein